MQDSNRPRASAWARHVALGVLMACAVSMPALAETAASEAADAVEAVDSQAAPSLESGHRLAPVEAGAEMAIENVDKSVASPPICGLLQYHSDENGWFHFRGIANGSLIVNFSEGGVIRSRMQESIVRGAWHHYDTKQYRYQLGFTCQ